MDNNIIKIFNNAKLESKNDLSEKIWRVILLKQKRIYRFKSIIYSLISILSLISFIPLSKILINDFIESGFYEYSMLLFSNTNNLIFYWKELFYSLAESLPALSIVITFTVFLIFFLSLKFTIKQIIKGQLSLLLKI